MPDRNSKFQIDPKNANKYIFPLVSQDTLIVQNNAKSVLFPISYRPSAKSKTNNLSLKSGKKCLHAFPKAPSFVILDESEIAGGIPSCPFQQKNMGNYGLTFLLKTFGLMWMIMIVTLRVLSRANEHRRLLDVTTTTAMFSSFHLQNITKKIQMYALMVNMNPS